MEELIPYLRYETFSLEDATKIESIIKQPILSLEPEIVKTLVYDYILPNIPERTLTLLSDATAECLATDVVLPKMLTICASPKLKLLYSKLNASQKDIFERIHQCFSSSVSAETYEIVSPQLILLDAAGGTGKTFLVNCIASSVSWKIIVAVKTRKLVESFQKILGLRAMTTCKFIMSSFTLKYDEAIKYFEEVEKLEDLVQHLYTILNGTFKKLDDMKLLIIDEYSLESPLFLLCICILGYRYRFNIMLMGDHKQQNTIQRSVHHKASNYELVQKFKNVVPIQLETQMRITDVAYLSKINKIRTHIENGNKRNGDVDVDYAFKYLIYSNFQPSFVRPENLITTIYGTDTHVKIRERILSIERYAQSQGIETKREPYYLYNVEEKTNVEFILPPDYKFLPYLLLVVGGIYIYKKGAAAEQVVEITSIGENHIICKDRHTDNLIVVNRIMWTAYAHACVDEQFFWMSQFTTEKIVQYPIRPLVITFHYMQGLTFESELMSFNLDVSTVNSVYVALSRICSEKQLVRIHTKEICSLMYTHYKKDEYYYKIKSPTPSMVTELCRFIRQNDYTFDDSTMQKCVKTVQRIREFEAPKFLLTRILKSAYVSNKRKHEERSTLLELYDFFMCNIDDISRRRVSSIELLDLYRKSITTSFDLENVVVKRASV